MHGTERSLCQKIANVHLCSVSNMVKPAIPSKYDDSFLTIKYILAFTFLKKNTIHVCLYDMEVIGDMEVTVYISGLERKP